MDIQTICNWIVLVSAVIIALKNIYGFFKKPVDTIQNRAREDEENHIKEIIEQCVPCMIEELKSGALSSVESKIGDIKDIVLEQNSQIKDINLTLEKVKNSSKDVLRIRMNEIYYTYLPYRIIRNSDKQLFDSLYHDYEQLKGNSAWQKMNETVQTWTVVDDDYKFE